MHGCNEIISSNNYDNCEWKKNNDTMKQILGMEVKNDRRGKAKSI